MAVAAVEEEEEKKKQNERRGWKKTGVPPATTIDPLRRIASHARLYIGEPSTTEGRRDRGRKRPKHGHSVEAHVGGVARRSCGGGAGRRGCQVHAMGVACI